MAWPADLKTRLEVIAIVGAAVFFAWKLYTGWLIINLGVTLNTERAPARTVNGEATDYLAVTTILEKGTTDTLRLRDVTIRVTAAPPQHVAPSTDTSVARVKSVEEIYRLAVASERIVWDSRDPRGKQITLSPGELVQFARVFEVPSDRPAFVEVAIFGTRPLWTGFQWRASAVSLPRIQEQPDPPPRAELKSR